MSPDLPVLSREAKFFDSYGHLWASKKRPPIEENPS